MQLDAIGLVKSFGPNLVLDQVSFSARSGAAIGLLGRNGAGKTTTIRTIMNVFPPDEGQILLDGETLRHSKTRIGYLPEEKGLYPKIKIGDQLIYLGELRGLSRKQAKVNMQKWLERLDMLDIIDKKLETLSKGNQQKIQLAVTLLADPQIVILDEPFSGLDPVNSQLLKDIVHEQVEEGKIVLFSSHQMNYVETFCDDIALLHAGKIVLSGSIRDIKRSYARNRIRIGLSPDRYTAGAAAILEDLKSSGRLPVSVISLESTNGDCVVTLSDAKDRGELLQALLTAGLELEQFNIVEPTLEQIFVERTGDVIEPVEDDMSTSIEDDKKSKAAKKRKWGFKS
ncbi:MAG: ATP-binding cassette domain-containing protein [Clostridiaceae bacterium]|nr:ATP-binding cassette domain-containing protein [Clostridiaceae bacterium]